MNRVTHQLEN